MWDFLSQFFEFFTAKWQGQFGELQAKLIAIKEDTMKASEQLNTLTQAVQTAAGTVAQSCQTISDKLAALTAQVANNDVGPAEISAALQPQIDALNAVAATLQALAGGSAPPPPDQPPL